jgi:hypothetical protein
MIFVGEVIDVTPYPLATRDGTIIKTRVTFRIADPISGTTSGTEILDFLGGEWNGIGMAVAEMPRFKAGDRRVVFARRERSINPIVGFTQGVMQIARDARGVERILTAEGAPVARPEHIGVASPRGATISEGMTLADFRARIRSAVAGARRR